LAGAHVDEGTLAQNISTIRKALESGCKAVPGSIESCASWVCNNSCLARQHRYACVSGARANLGNGAYIDRLAFLREANGFPSGAR
jgi:hypothetical protein